MAGNAFEWDPNKEQTNRAKHGVSFALASLVFDDPNELTETARTIDGETRLQTIGRVGGVLLFVVHTTRQDRRNRLVVRIISARVTSKAERSRYERSDP